MAAPAMFEKIKKQQYDKDNKNILLDPPCLSAGTVYGKVENLRFSMENKNNNKKKKNNEKETEKKEANNFAIIKYIDDFIRKAINDLAALAEKYKNMPIIKKVCNILSLFNNMVDKIKINPEKQHELPPNKRNYNIEQLMKEMKEKLKKLGEELRTAIQEFKESCEKYDEAHKKYVIAQNDVLANRNEVVAQVKKGIEEAIRRKVTEIKAAVTGNNFTMNTMKEKGDKKQKFVDFGDEIANLEDDNFNFNETVEEQLVKEGVIDETVSGTSRQQAIIVSVSVVNEYLNTFPPFLLAALISARKDFFLSKRELENKVQEIESLVEQFVKCIDEFKKNIKNTGCIYSTSSMEKAVELAEKIGDAKGELRKRGYKLNIDVKEEPPQPQPPNRGFSNGM